MAKFVCCDYGFNCDFVTEGDTKKVIDEFGQHNTDLHGITYSRNILLMFLQNQNKQPESE